LFKVFLFLYRSLKNFKQIIKSTFKLQNLLKEKSLVKIK
jgi:hypothetical protein